MASPRVVIFPIFDATTKAPLAGQAPTFAYYRDETGVALAQPAITELGGGFYKFTPTLQTNHIVVYMLDCGAGADDRYPYDMIRAEDFDLDLVSGVAASVWDQARSAHQALGSFGDLMRVLWLVFTGRVKLDTAAGRFYVYAEDGTTVFMQQTTKNAAGGAGGLDATERLVAMRP
jgi:hypothetical protein